MWLFHELIAKTPLLLKEKKSHLALESTQRWMVLSKVNIDSLGVSYVHVLYFTLVCVVAVHRKNKSDYDQGGT